MNRVYKQYPLFLGRSLYILLTRKCFPDFLLFFRVYSYECEDFACRSLVHSQTNSI